VEVVARGEDEATEVGLALSSADEGWDDILLTKGLFKGLEGIESEAERSFVEVERGAASASGSRRSEAREASPAIVVGADGSSVFSPLSTATAVPSVGAGFRLGSLGGVVVAGSMATAAPSPLGGRVGGWGGTTTSFLGGSFGCSFSSFGLLPPPSAGKPHPPRPHPELFFLGGSAGLPPPGTDIEDDGPTETDDSFSLGGVGSVPSS
jgi:hypothetical protein